MKTEIIFEDKDILVIYKPAGLATQTAKIGQADVVSELKNYLIRTGKAGAPYLGIVHRLDQPVEGLLVFAKNQKAAGNLTAQLQKQGAEVGLNKHYYAVLCGKPTAKTGELVDFIYKNTENAAVIVEKTAEQEASKAREARLKYTILEEIPADGETVGGSGQSAPRHTLALADIEIFTGRFHQIRAQMAHAGLPLLGDLKYGDEAAKELAKQRNVRNVALCAYKLEFLHPATKKKMAFVTKPKGIAFSFFKVHEK